MARMTAMAMLLPGLLAAFLPAIAVTVSIMLRARNTWPFTTAKDVSGSTLRVPVMAGVSCMVVALCHAVLPIAAMAGVSSLSLCHAVVPRGNQQVNHPFALPSASPPHVNVTAACQNATCGPPTPAHTIVSSLQHAHALNVPLHFLHSLLSCPSPVLCCHLFSTAAYARLPLVLPPPTHSPPSSAVVCLSIPPPPNPPSPAACQSSRLLPPASLLVPPVSSPPLPLPASPTYPATHHYTGARLALGSSAMARRTAVAMLLPGLLVAFLLGAAITAICIISFTGPDRDAYPPVAVDDNGTDTSQNATCLPPIQAHAIAASGQQAHALDVSRHNLLSVFMLYSAVSTLFSTLMALLWGMGVTHTQVREWVHQQGLAVTAGLMKLRSASKCLLVCHALCHCPLTLQLFLCQACLPSRGTLPHFFMPSLKFWLPLHASLPSFVVFSPALPSLWILPSLFALIMLQPCGIFPLLHSPMTRVTFGMQRVGEAVGTVMASMSKAHESKEKFELGEAMEMRMRALGMQLEETRRELEKAERRRVAEMREMRGQAEERERGLAAVKGEVKVKLTEHKLAVAEQLDVAERRRGSKSRELREEARQGRDELREELAREREERTKEVQELNWRRVLKEVAACRNRVDVDLEISQSGGGQKTAWEVSAG
ncbi:unnamed protein product [Closterium sp. Naga37s-1]|nr:unnamed protein product [Closterium sp. Naga37s-1]